jgi:hypothetical protein
MVCPVDDYEKADELASLLALDIVTAFMISSGEDSVPQIEIEEPGENW